MRAAVALGIAILPAASLHRADKARGGRGSGGYGGEPVISVRGCVPKNGSYVAPHDVPRQTAFSATISRTGAVAIVTPFAARGLELRPNHWRCRPQQSSPCHNRLRRRRRCLGARAARSLVTFAFFTEPRCRSARCKPLFSSCRPSQTLEFHRLIYWRLKPCRHLLHTDEEHRYRFGIKRPNHVVGQAGQKRESAVVAVHRFPL